MFHGRVVSRFRAKRLEKHPFTKRIENARNLSPVQKTKIAPSRIQTWVGTWERIVVSAISAVLRKGTFRCEYRTRISSLIGDNDSSAHGLTAEQFAKFTEGNGHVVIDMTIGQWRILPTYDQAPCVAKFTSVPLYIRNEIYILMGENSIEKPTGI